MPIAFIPEEIDTLRETIARLIENDKYPSAPRLRPLKSILAKLPPGKPVPRIKARYCGEKGGTFVTFYPD